MAKFLTGISFMGVYLENEDQLEMEEKIRFFCIVLYE